MKQNIYTYQPDSGLSNSPRHSRPVTSRSGKRARHIAAAILFSAFSGISNLYAMAATPLAGRWDLTIITPKGQLPSWIEISEENGTNKLVMVGVTDHATPLQTFDISGRRLQFVSPKGEEGFSNEMQFKGQLVGQQLEGTVTDSSGDSWHWVGVRAPRLDRSSNPQWGTPIQLFNGKNLDGWRLLDPARGGNWKVQDGTLIKDGHGSELATNAKFEDFKLHVVFKCGPSSNAGVFLRGRYEVQIETDSVSEPNSHHTGGVYGFLDPTPEQPRKADVWQTFDITLVGRKVTVVQNGITVIDNKEIPGITGGALDSHEAMPGPIYLQGSEEGTVTFKEIVITPAK